MSLTLAASRLFDAALSLVYPQPCAVCGSSVEARADGVACAKCWDATRIFALDEIVCWKCGALSSGQIAIEQREEVRCGRCDQQVFTAARACGSYEGALRATVLRLKREPYVCGRLIRLLVEAQSRAPLNHITRVVPVPLHPEREKVRGFNQAALIARELARAARLPLTDTSVVRTVHSRRHRAGMDAKGRHDSVADAFAVCQPRVVSGERVLLVDDVFTTGATASACAGALLDAGATDVCVLTIARPLP